MTEKKKTLLEPKEKPFVKPPPIADVLFGDAVEPPKETVAPPQAVDNVEVGIFPGVSYEEYNSWPYVRKSNLWVLSSRTPAHYKYIIDHPEEFDYEHFLIGHASHTVVLEPDRFDKLYTVRPATYTNAKGEEKPWSGNAKYCKEYMAELRESGLIDLSPEQYELCNHIRDSIYADEELKDWLEAGIPEVSMVWIDKKTGIPMKGRIDLWVPDGGIIIDLKTTRNANVMQFGNDSYRYGYHFQMALYYDGVTQATGQELSNPVLVAIEKEPPYCVAHYEVERYKEGMQTERDNLELGRSQYEIAMMHLAECMKTGEWPGYNKGLMPLVLPGYAGMEISGT